MSSSHVVSVMFYSVVANRRQPNLYFNSGGRGWSISGCIRSPRRQFGRVLEAMGYDRGKVVLPTEPHNKKQGNLRIHIARTSCVCLLTTSRFRQILDPFRTAVPFWGQTTWKLSGLSPKRDCRSKRVKKSRPWSSGFRTFTIFLE